MAAADSQVNAGRQEWLARNPALGVPTDELRDAVRAAGVTDVAVRRARHRRHRADRHLTVVPAVAGSADAVPAVAAGSAPAEVGWPDGAVPTGAGAGGGRVGEGPAWAADPAAAAAGPPLRVAGTGGTADAAVRVAVVDDHPVFRLGLAALLDSLPDLGVVGAAADVDGALAVVERYRPDVVVLDLRLAGGSGVAATREILARYPGTGVLVVTTLADEESVCAALRAGARGYLLKGAAPAELERAVRAVANGEVLLGPEVAGRAVGQLSAGRTGGPPPFPELTGREREVLDLVAQGLSNVLVARRLTLSPKTVRNHLSNVLHKLQVADRSQAILRARQAGLGRC